MDQRQTFGDLVELKTILDQLQREQTVAALLADREGLFRISGKIVSVSKEQALENATILFDNGTSLKLNEIIAVNGIFRSDYSEC